MVCPELGKFRCIAYHQQALAFDGTGRTLDVPAVCILQRFERNSFLFTSESVSEGHPDKVADQISDSIVDLFLSKDPEARVACETLTTTQLVVLAGEIRCKGVFEDGEWAPGALDEIEATVRNTVKEIGYEQSGFHWNQFRFENNLHGQSAHIAQGVDASGNTASVDSWISDPDADPSTAAVPYSTSIRRDNKPRRFSVHSSPFGYRARRRDPVIMVL